MSEPTESRPAETPPPTAAPRRSSGCVGRFVSALLVVLITTFLSVVTIVLVYLFVLETPGQIADLRGRAATAEAQSASLRAQNDVMQTQVAELARRADANREALGELQQQKAALDGLRQELEQAGRQNATVVAEARTSRDAVALFATAEAGRAGLLDELKRRSDRIERFLQRLSDISADAALDLGSASPAPSIAAPAPFTEVPAATDTPEPTPTATQIDTPAPEPTATTRPTATPRPQPTATETPTVAPSSTPTPR